jgi:hypothetical protein
MSLKIACIQTGAKLIFSLCFLLSTIHCWAQQNTLNFFLSSRNCSNCIYYTKLLNKIPYYIPSKIIIDVPLESFEFSFLIDSVLEIDRYKYQFEFKKEIPEHLFNKLQVINGNGNIIYQSTILSISNQLYSILGFWDNQVLLSYKIKSKFPFFNSTTLLPNDDSTIFCYSYTADRLLHIDLKSKKEYEYTPKQINLHDVYQVIYSDSIKAEEAYKILSNSEEVFKRIQIDNFFSVNETAYILYRVKVPVLLASDSTQLTYQYISKYVIGTFNSGHLIELTPVVGQIEFDNFYIDKEYYFIQSMAINGGIFKMESNENIVIGVSKASYTTHNQKYFARFEKNNKQYVYSKQQTSILNNHLKEVSKLIPKESIDDYNFSNFASYTKQYIFFRRQFMLYNIFSKSWLPLKFNNPNLDTLKIKPKNFSSQILVEPNIIKTLNYTKTQNYPCFILYSFNVNGNLIQSDTIILNNKYVLSTPYLTSNGITVIDNDGVIRTYSYNYIPTLFSILRTRKNDE